MIGSARTGTSFGGLGSYLLSDRGVDDPGLQDYLLGKGESAERVLWAATRNLPEDDPSRAALYMSAKAAQNTRVKKPVYHLSISAAPGEQISRAEWEAIADRVLRKLGLEEHQALVVAHGDKAHPHIHLMVNRVHPETLRAWSNSHDFAKIERALRPIEREMALREVPGHHYQLPGQQPPERRLDATPGEKREEARTGEESWGRQVRFNTYQDLREATSWADLERRLARHGLRLQARGGGLVVTDGKRSVKASRIYRRGSAHWLEKRFGMSFRDYRRELEALRSDVDRYRTVEAERRELVDRRQELGRRMDQFDHDRDQQRQAEAGVDRAVAGLHETLARLYGPEDAAAAQERIVEFAREQGWERAWDELERHPTRFGSLVLPGRPGPEPPRRQRLGRLPGRRLRRRRSLAQDLARRAASFGRNWLFFRSLHRVGGPAAVRLTADALFVRRQIHKVNRRLDALPSERDLLKDVALRTATLGFSVVRLVLAPRPLAVVRTAVKAAELARSLQQGRGR